MSMTGFEAFDTTVRKTNTWLNDLMQLLGWKEKEKQKAYLAMRATLHALRDRLTTDDVAQFGAQLPMLMRGFYYEGWDPSDKPVKERHREAFLAQIARDFPGDECNDPERVARAVFMTLVTHVSAGEIENVKQVLPAELKALWPEQVSVAAPK
jgi:uncharacterized protein (DUF2267 family)